MWRFLGKLLMGLGAVAVLAAALLFYFLYAPAPAKPHLGGRLTRASVAVGGLDRSYLLYVPRGLPRGAPLVMVLHGSGEAGPMARIETGYGFERLADVHRFAVAYPDAYEGYWNACNKVGDYAANARNIDDVAFLTRVADKLSRDLGIDRAKTFAAGLSRGGQMAYRLALEAPQRFRAVAAVSASLPTPDNFKCKPARGGTPAVMIMNGTDDPLNPFNGGEVTLYGFLRRGTVLSSFASAQYFARANGIAGAPATRVDGNVERTLWHGGVDVEFLAILGAGHVIPQPYRRAPRLLGPSPTEPNGPAVIWDFFERSM